MWRKIVLLAEGRSHGGLGSTARSDEVAFLGQPNAPGTNDRSKQLHMHWG